MDLKSSVNYTSPANNLVPTSHNFEDLPVEKPLSRSRYKVPFRNTGTCNASKLIPFFWKYVMPNMTTLLAEKLLETAVFIRSP